MYDVLFDGDWFWFILFDATVFKLPNDSWFCIKFSWLLTTKFKP